MIILQHPSRNHNLNRNSDRKRRSLMAALGSVEPANHPRSRLSIEILKFRRLLYKEKCILIFSYVFFCTENIFSKTFVHK